jgi:hypothetical protein
MVVNAGFKRVICSDVTEEFHEDSEYFNFKIYLIEDWLKFWETHDINEDPEVYGKTS